MSSEITRLLEGWRQGDEEASGRLIPLVYSDLRHLARLEIRRRHGNATLDPTALVHEAYLRLSNQSVAPWKNRGHFFAVAAKAMRQIIVDHARKRLALKRGSGQGELTLDEKLIAVDEQAETLLALDQALEKLSQLSDRMTQVVECRFFAGLTAEETAEALGVTRRTVQRDWLKAQALLKKELSPLGSQPLT
ncbi:MAG: sigma-70 family RNA polymerase sigma factor [Deltaproteobacteria bacterium]|nr:sigma-70 family RNA polymerase sigma factor [Deltaproteobacteria bacterium]